MLTFFVQAYSPLVRGTKIDDSLLVPLAKKHQKTTTQILLRWGLQKVGDLLGKWYCTWFKVVLESSPRSKTPRKLRWR